MPFLQVGTTAREVPAAGPQNAKIAIIGEAPGAYEIQQLKPFVGPAGGVLEQCLHAAGLIRSEVYLTNVVKVKPPGNDIAPFFTGTTGTFTAAGMDWVRALQDELHGVGANVLVACGATALAALTCEGNRGKKGILKYRGYVMGTCGLDRVRKMIPCIHPSAALRGMYLYRHMIAADLKKAKQVSDSPDFDRPVRQLVFEFGTVEEVLEWLEYYTKADIVAFDIEVMNFEVSCMSFSSDPNIACSIPLLGQWTEQELAQIWRGIAQVLGNSRSVKVVQNGIFDIQFLLTRCNIAVHGPIHDTMIAHSVMFPELRKGLDFLVSIYGGNQEYYKDWIRFDNIKEES